MKEKVKEAEEKNVMDENPLEHVVEDITNTFQAMSGDSISKAMEKLIQKKL